MTSNEPRWCKPSELRKLPRLIVCKCHNCGEIGFANNMTTKSFKCKKCFHGYYTLDIIEDSWNPIHSDTVRFTQAVVPEWRSEAPWVFAWFPHKCPVEGCGETYWKPVDKFKVLGWEVKHTCDKNVDIGLLVQEVMAQQDAVWEQMRFLDEKMIKLRQTVALQTAYNKPR